LRCCSWCSVRMWPRIKHFHEQTAMRVPWEDQIEAFAIAMAMGWFYDTVFAQLGDLPE
jgi:hypothetical protein